MSDAASTTRLLSGTDLPAPVEGRWFEEYPVGSSYGFGQVRLTPDDIVEFARRYDPQAIHVDPVYAAQGPFAGLIASGMQTMAVATRMYVDHYVSQVASLTSPGLDEIRWPRPVRPADRLRLRMRSRPPGCRCRSPTAGRCTPRSRCWPTRTRG